MSRGQGLLRGLVVLGTAEEHDLYEFFFFSREEEGLSFSSPLSQSDGK